MITVKSNINYSEIKVQCDGAKKLELLTIDNRDINLNIREYPNLIFQTQEFNTYNKFIFNEDLIGIKNGANNTFTIQNNIIPDSEQILSNGFIINKPQDYNISGNTITLNFSPESYESLTINYIKL